MNYIYLLLSALLDGAKGCLSKNLSRISGGFRDSLILNLFRTVLCVICGCIMVPLSSESTPSSVAAILWIPLLSGGTMSVFMVSWLLALRTGALMTLTVLGSAANLIPVILAYICFGEPILTQHLIGLALFLVASVLLCSYNRSLNGKMTPKDILYLTLMFLSCGMMSFVQKLYVYSVPGGNIAFFNLLTYVFASVLLGSLLLINRKDRIKKRAAFLWRKTAPTVIFLSVSLFFVDFFRTKAAVSIPAGILYPMSSGIVLVINQLYSSLVLREKPTPKELTGMLLTLAAMIVINL